MILASNSQRRQEILKDAGFNFKVITSNIEETSDKKIITERILDIAEKKLEQIAKNNKNKFILAADTVVELNGKIFGKPKNREEAFSFLKTLSGQIHRVITAYVFKNISKKSITYFKKIKEYDRYTLLEAELKTGRTHQLRAQLNHIGNNIVGDTKYGRNEKEDIMYLFSYYLKIDLYNLEIKLEIPNFFNKK